MATINVSILLLLLFFSNICDALAQTKVAKGERASVLLRSIEVNTGWFIKWQTSIPWKDKSKVKCANEHYMQGAVLRCGIFQVLLSKDNSGTPHCVLRDVRAQANIPILTLGRMTFSDEEPGCAELSGEFTIIQPKTRNDEIDKGKLEKLVAVFTVSLRSGELKNVDAILVPRPKIGELFHDVYFINKQQISYIIQYETANDGSCCIQTVTLTGTARRQFPSGYSARLNSAKEWFVQIR